MEPQTVASLALLSLPIEILAQCLIPSSGTISIKQYFEVRTVCKQFCAAVDRMLHPVKIADFAALRDPANYKAIYYNRRHHPRTDDDKPNVTKLVQSVPQLLGPGADFQEYILSWDTLYHNTWELYHAMISEISADEGAEVQKRRIGALRWLSDHRLLRQCDIHWAIFSALAPWIPHPPKPKETESTSSSSSSSNFVSKLISRLKSKKNTKEAEPVDADKEAAPSPPVEPTSAEPEFPKKLNAPISNLKKMLNLTFFPLDMILGNNEKAKGGIEWLNEKHPREFKIMPLIWQLNDTAMGATRLQSQHNFCEKFFPSYRVGDSSSFWVLYANHKKYQREGDDDGKLDLWLGEDFVCILDAASGRALGIHMIDHY
eukprot:TRINITY_DN15212_c0_g1_i1.p1 TRINITY_DN15212_c0_g1~~TRINITY_DN15212_c0_g1_i1.p1  ORF type:complete len:373 (+),score=64.76 TRINITY_DN15212_c0_g1_i1:561-1679(+)